MLGLCSASRNPRSSCFLGITVSAHISPHTLLFGVLTAALGVRLVMYMSAGPFPRWENMHKPKGRKGCTQVDPTSWSGLGSEYELALSSCHSLPCSFSSNHNELLGICFLSISSLLLSQGLGPAVPPFDRPFPQISAGLSPSCLHDSTAA